MEATGAQQLKDIYCGPVKEHEKRYQTIYKRFGDIFGEEPEFYIRVPGRANLLCDYMSKQGYPSMKITLEQDIVLAFSRSSGSEYRFVN